MSAAIAFIPTFVTAILILGGANGLSLVLLSAGIFAILTHAASSPDLLSPYPNFDNYHPGQPPLRDYVLVFGLLGLILVALCSRVHPSLCPLVRATWRKVAPRVTAPGSSSRVQGSAGFSPRSTHAPQPPPSPSTAPASFASTLQTADAIEIAALEARVSQLEASLDEMRCRLDALTTGQKDAASGISTTVVAEPSPPPPHLSAPILPLSPSPVDPNPFPKLVDTRELGSLVGSLMEGTRQTDQLILKMRAILAEADVTDDEVRLPSRSTQSFLAKHVPPSSSATPTLPSHSSSSSSSSTRPDALRKPLIRKIRVPLPLASAVGQVGEASRSSRTTAFNLTLGFSGISKVPCSTPVRLAEEFEQSISPACSRSSSDPLKIGLDRQSLVADLALDASQGAGTRVRQASRATSILSRVTPQNGTLRYARNRLREHSSTALSLPPSRPRFESAPDSQRDAKGKAKGVRVLAGMSGWLAEYRRRKKKARESCPLHIDCQG